ncbi:MAG: hypothetical protein ACREC6_04045 [Hyphomicrobiaceae bacterium]
MWGKALPWSAAIFLSLVSLHTTFVGFRSFYGAGNLKEGNWIELWLGYLIDASFPLAIAGIRASGNLLGVCRAVAALSDARFGPDSHPTRADDCGEVGDAISGRHIGFDAGDLDCLLLRRAPRMVYRRGGQIQNSGCRRTV